MEPLNYDSSAVLPDDLVDGLLNGILPDDQTTQLFSPLSTPPDLFLSSPENFLSSPENSFISSPEDFSGTDEPLYKRSKSNSIYMEQWTPYYPATRQYYPLCDHLYTEIQDLMDMRIRIDKIDHAEHYSPADDAYILYRQNQFQLELDLMGSLKAYNSPSSYPPTPYMVNSNGLLVPIEGLFFHVYAIKQHSNRKSTTGSVVEQEEMVELAQLGGPRSKREFQNPELCHIQNGRAVFQRLQFRAATANNARSAPDKPNPNQQYYRLIVSLVAKTSTTLCFIASKISPCLIVRGQNPGKFQLVKEPKVETPNDAKNMKRTHSEAIAQTSLSVEVKPDGWKADVNNRAVYTGAKVGINTASPQEALTVHGNILVTGDIVKPSDQRIKMNIEPVDTKSQLKNIEKLELFEYDVKGVGAGPQLHERGVLAQELQKIMPNAVRVVKGVTLSDGTTIPELLVVQDRALLFETIGATQQLNKDVVNNRERVYLLDTNLTNHVQETRRMSKRIATFVHNAMEFVFAEREGSSEYVGDDSPCLFITAYGDKSTCHMSFFGLGHAWTLWILGFFFPLFWFVGSFFIASISRVKYIAGIVHAITFVSWIAFICITSTLPPNLGLKLYFSIFFPMNLGMAVLAIFGIYWKRKKNLRKLRQNDSLHQLISEFATETAELQEQPVQLQPMGANNNNNNSNNNNSTNNSGGIQPTNQLQQPHTPPPPSPQLPTRPQQATKKQQTEKQQPQLIHSTPPTPIATKPPQPIITTTTKTQQIITNTKQQFITTTTASPPQQRRSGDEEEEEQLRRHYNHPQQQHQQQQQQLREKENNNAVAIIV